MLLQTCFLTAGEEVDTLALSGAGAGGRMHVSELCYNVSWRYGHACREGGG